ncbi:hypothetical protein PSPO01_11746 [Paraphaeosphaeria sporulosa]
MIQSFNIDNSGTAKLHLIGPGKGATDLIDIVFVHQIGGDPKSSWQSPDSPSFSWAVHTSKAIPEARVWSFGYPMGNKIILENLAQDLAQQLCSLRIKDREAGVISSTDIPKIVFVAAGIGGVITLLWCKIIRDASKMSIWEGCVGIVFLGCPHGKNQDAYRPWARAHGMLIDRFKDIAPENRGQCLDVDNERIVDDMEDINNEYLEIFPEVPPSLSVINEDAGLDPLAPQRDNGIFPVVREGTDNFKITRHQVRWYAFADPEDSVLQLILEKIRQWISSPMKPRESGLRLLSLDGGGIRGLCSLMILDRIMEEVQRVENSDTDGASIRTCLPCDYFELAGGTSTGGYVAPAFTEVLHVLKVGYRLIAIMLFRLRMDTKTAIHEYKTLAPKIFRGSVSVLMKYAFNGFIFDGKTLENEVKEMVKGRISRGEAQALSGDIRDAPLRPTIESLRHLEQGKMFVSAVLRPNNEPCRLRNYWPRDTRPRFGGCTIWEAARATSAAPFYFPPAFISDMEFWDGGVQNNNPIDEVDAERRDLWPLRKISCIISIGTGKSSKVKSTGLLALRTFKALLDNLTNTEIRHQAFIEKAKSERIDYFRFNPTTGNEIIGLADYQLMGKLESFTEQYLETPETQQELKKCAELLVKRTYH